jgi:Arylsulfotransferase (ASST)
MIRSTLSRLSGGASSAALIASGAAASGALLFAPGALALTVSPLNGTPDASPHTQISFLGAPSAQVSDLSVVGSRSGAHRGRLEDYASAPGASFLPSRPFSPEEHVTVSAVVGRSHERVSWTFTVARQLANPVPATASALPPKPGTVQGFVSEPTLEPPSVRVAVRSPAVAPGYIFLTPNHGYGPSGPMIIEDTGQLVWFQAVPRGSVAMDLQVQRYEGKPVLVWWQGRIIDGVGWGTNEIYGSNYQPVAQIAGGNGYKADLHAVRLTPEGSAYITAYSLVRVDLSSVGGSHHAILQDAILQEVDIKTGLVMFEWHAYGHVPLSDSYYRPGPVDHPWDYFHINSVSPDPWPDGNFIISARNTWTAYEIDHHTGAIRWQIGGKHPSFRMGQGTGTAWQHDVRWQPDHTLTIFDNGAVPKKHSESRVIRERIDWAHHAVTLVGRDVHSPPILSGSQGDDETLPNGDTFVGWGEEPYFTEFSPTGQVLFDAHLIAPGQSYRAFRFAWSGSPASAPAIAVKSTGPNAATVYASWNGATNVSGWVVRAGRTRTALTQLASSARTGFETAIAVHGGRTWFEVQALDAAGQVLGTSAAVHR